MPQAFTEAEIADFLAELDGFRRTLAPRQQQILDTLLEAAAAGDATLDPDVEGYSWRPQRDLAWTVEPKRIVRVLRNVTGNG